MPPNYASEIAGKERKAELASAKDEMEQKSEDAAREAPKKAEKG